MNYPRRHFLHLLSGLAVAPLAGAAETSLNVAGAAKYVAARKGYALLIKQHGKVIHESYANGAKKGEARRIYSGTKGFWGLAAMAAVEDGHLALNEKVSATLPSWQRGGKENITIEQLLDFNCGLERCLKLHQDGLSNRNQMALDRPLVGTPGKSFIYGPSALQVFHEVLKQKLKGRFLSESPTRYLERRVLRPLGLGSQRYLADAKGNPLLAAGFLMTPSQWARMGDLLLAQGKPVLKASSMGPLLEGSSSNAAYSFGFWNNRAADKMGAREIDIEDMLEVDWDRQNWSRVCIAKGVPKDLIACIGSGYQRMYAIPSMALVIVRQGLNARYSDGDFLRTLLG
ncbi:serine hydrolase domain-containing protein [Prosthecobacter algae]|uniref:Serine hydrolase domain-containing protein n=1 Tax=Prosthecobacter algae TaxID=1144682 RepID=A0ABP9NV19_9BACT